MGQVAFALTLSLSLCLPAQAHTHWADGSPVPAWVKAQCCGVADAHHLTPDQVHSTTCANGSRCYHIDGYKGGDVPASTLLPSQDGDWWVFYSDQYVSPIYCFFGPLSF